ncbi:MAG TPA: hypothetical protein VK803_07910 [Steroidobacteraceae bacterium]|nr:hypothetical protein [Steroidobacteraceae bacterium]
MPLVGARSINRYSQIEVVRAIAHEVRVTLSAQEERSLDLDGAISIDSRAHELYLRGRHFWYKRTEEGMRESIECFQQAIQYDSFYAPPSFGLSDAHTMLACRGGGARSGGFFIRPRQPLDKVCKSGRSGERATRLSLTCDCTTAIGSGWNETSPVPIEGTRNT